MNDRGMIVGQLRWHWLLMTAIAVCWLASLLLCHFYAEPLRVNWSAVDREWLRSVLYALAIILFPFTNLLRYILLRLNQTMPGNKNAQRRYFTTVAVCLILIESVSAFGLIMFMLGDGYNTLYIFSSLGALGLFLHRPKNAEYAHIVDALEHAEMSAPGAGKNQAERGEY